MVSASNHDDSDDGDGPITVLTFDLEAERYCVRAAAVASVLGVADEQSIGSATDPWNAGTVTLAGERVRVIDLPRAFTAVSRTTARIADPKLLVFTATDADDAHYGWLVDDVDATRTVRQDRLEPTRTSTRLAHVKGRLEIDGDDVIWLDERTIHD
ncbi:chemotaxis protein CheW [Natronorubrum sulfidifaciens]|uniref:Chemotaxis protein CheW n=1 Tax=Natronorubrum sulfidifaciens JCM 14089 TaxID=1230460 RepID=L9W828_9EURY|nr:chemotaxis protein CheW [Natronorubrum sulfidifaciens]ELY44473.1 chemotaxis protein CheW [Natronorubrum sulfidifaciens JCM 14089]